MRTERFDGKKPRRILIGMIVSDTVCGRIAPKWEKGGLFKSPWENLVGEWCVTFYRKYGKAPRKAIEGVYEAWAQDAKDRSTGKLVDSLLRELDGEYKRASREINPDYIIDLAGEYFNQIRVEKLREALQGDLDIGKVEKAVKRINEFGGVEISEENSYVDFLHDKEAVRDTFSHKVESLIKYPGALGEFFGDELCRDAFIAFESPAKRGKSWWLMDLVWNGMLQRRRVAYFQLGDLSRRQVLNRLYVRATRRPRKPRSVSIPKKMTWDDEGGVRLKRIEKEFTKPLSSKTTLKALQEIADDRIKSDKSFLRISVHSSRSLPVIGMISILKEWERRDGWIPDIIVTDYADLFKMPSGHAESRDAINENWIGLRGASQDFHCLVVTATQTGRQSYSKEEITMEDTSEDIRKNAHVTGMISINQTPEERDEGIYRLKWDNLREDENPASRIVYTASCLAIANPAVLSCFAKNS